MKRIKNTRLQLWLHIVSKHAAIVDPFAPLAELEDFHAHEHAGPGTIRNHKTTSLDYSLKRAGEVLSGASR